MEEKKRESESGSIASPALNIREKETQKNNNKVMFCTNN